MSVRRSRKRKREESDEVLDTTVEDKNDETVTPATPEPNGEGTFAETEEKEMQDKDQLVWEAFREEYIESVEQLPLTLHRQFTLMRELDSLAMSSQSKLVPALLEYIAKRQEIERARLQRQRGTPDASHNTVSHHSERGETVLRWEEAVQQDNYDLTRSNGLTNGARDANGIIASGSTPSRRGSEVPSLAPPPSGRARSSSSAVSVSTVGTSARALESSVSPLSRTRHTHETLAYISDLIGELMRTSEEKLNLAQAAYDSVDRHVRLLDQAIREQEARVPPELRPRSSFSIIAPIQQSPGGPSYPNPIPNVGSGLDALVAAAQQGAEVELLPGAAEKSSSRSHRKGHRRKVSESARQKAGEAPDVASGDPNIPTSAGALANLSDVPGGVPEFVLTDMPIDPHEPRYCYCNQVSWGEMIACDNPNCEKEWFHLGCVGLAEAPKGRWFCDDCKDKKERPGGSSTRRRGH